MTAYLVWPPSRDELARMTADRMSDADIGQLYGIGRERVRRLRRTLGLPPIARVQTDDRIRELHRAGWTDAMMCSSLRIKIDAMRERRERLGLIEHKTAVTPDDGWPKIEPGDPIRNMLRASAGLRFEDAQIRIVRDAIMPARAGGYAGSVTGSSGASCAEIGERW